MMTLLSRSFAMMAISLTVAGVTGCSTIRRNVADSSLNYASTSKLAVLQLPADSQTLPFTPLYHVPQTGQNTLKLSGDKNKRFVLPAPITAAQ